MEEVGRSELKLDPLFIVSVLEVQREMHLFLSWRSIDWKMDPYSDTPSFHVTVVHKWLCHSCCNLLILTWSDKSWRTRHCVDVQMTKQRRIEKKSRPTGCKQAWKVSHQRKKKKGKKGEKIIILCNAWLEFLEKFELFCCFWLSVPIMLTKDFLCVFFYIYVYICLCVLNISSWTHEPYSSVFDLL